jgi:NAD(P)-dependent dehydrogenase (short-subunit alcohol dehydrogenase family)
MTVLVVGATGATGQLLVKQLLGRGNSVKVIVRAPDKVPDSIRTDSRLAVIHANLLDLTDAQLAQHVDGCAAVASCLGHNLNLKGIYGSPRMLVADATRRLCHAIKTTRPIRPVKFVLMNTAGNRNGDAFERIGFMENVVVGMIRILLPPHRDNERAADFLRKDIGQSDGVVEWVVVRPDTLIDAAAVTDYDVYTSPIRSAIFNAGRTSRINVAHFMAGLIDDGDMWRQWKGQMPVIYSGTGSGSEA